MWRGACICSSPCSHTPPPRPPPEVIINDNDSDDNDDDDDDDNDDDNDLTAPGLADVPHHAPLGPNPPDHEEE